MTISERIFMKLKEIKMTQKEFSERTGISQSAISEWKSKNTNPSADKIMIICHVLNVTPEWLLSGTEKSDNRTSVSNYYVIDKQTEIGELVCDYSQIPEEARNRIIGYVQALAETHRLMMQKKGKEVNDIKDYNGKT